MTYIVARVTDGILRLPSEWDGKVVEVTQLEENRTDKQNKALHLYFSLLANKLQDAGVDMRQMIRQEVPITPTAHLLKETVWRPLQKALFGKKSTRELSTKDIDKIYAIMDKVIAERTGVRIEFPSQDSLYYSTIDFVQK